MIAFFRPRTSSDEKNNISVGGRKPKSHIGEWIPTENMCLEDRMTWRASVLPGGRSGLPRGEPVRNQEYIVTGKAHGWSEAG